MKYMRAVISQLIYSTFLIAIWITVVQQETLARPANSQAIIDIGASELPFSFDVGRLKGELTATSPELVYEAGASAFVQMRLSTEVRRGKDLSAELLLETDQGEIAEITGSGIKTEQEGDRYRIRISGINRKRSKKVLIEVKLAATASQEPNRLKFVMRAEDEDRADLRGADPNDIAEQTLALTWPVTSCGVRYHAALQKIGAEGGNDLRKLWRTVSRPDKSMSQHWMFRPSIPKRSRRRRSSDDDAAMSRREVRAIYLEAQQLTRTGYDSALRRDGQYGWMLSKTAGDLKKYFSQDMKPAICTGALAFAAYYEERLSPLRKRGERYGKLADDAVTLAGEKAGEVFRAARSLPGGHPAWGGATLVALRPVDSEPDDLKALIENLLTAADFPKEAIDDVGRRANAYEALKILDDKWLKTADLPKQLNRQLRAALGSVEAAVRLKAFHQRYAEFWQGFAGKLEAIRAAHAEHCVCSTQSASTMTGVQGSSPSVSQ